MTIPSVHSIKFILDEVHEKLETGSCCALYTNDLIHLTKTVKKINEISQQMLNVLFACNKTSNFSETEKVTLILLNEKLLKKKDLFENIFAKERVNKKPIDVLWFNL